MPAAALLADQLREADPGDPHYATRFVERLLAAGVAAGASDVHLLPTAAGLEVRWRIDGVLQSVGEFSATARGNIVARLKVLAELLTYQTELPQEGRIRARGSVEMRVSTFPTAHGEKVVVRLFAPTGARLLILDELGLPEEVARPLQSAIQETSGAILVTGPAGSGKTTTAYACLREIADISGGGRSLCSLEDPVEVLIPGVAQSQVNPAAGFDLAVGLRSLMRQDPEVILLGEMRDRAAAEIALGAALTGQLVLSTFHAPSAAGAISRLSDMGIEPYVLRSGILAIVAQRLVRRLCQCAEASRDDAARLGLPVDAFCLPRGCQACGGTGYRGRLLLAEMLTCADAQLGRAVLARDDAASLEQIAVEAGMVPLWQRAVAAVAAGATSPGEIRRVMGCARLPSGGG